MTQNTQPTVADVRSVMEEAYPPYLAEKWDAVGLICGDPQQEVHKIVVALDCTQEVAEAAVNAEADMLIVHHPLLLRGVTSVAADTPKGKVIHTLIRGELRSLPPIPTRIPHAPGSTTSSLNSLVSCRAAPYNPNHKE